MEVDMFAQLGEIINRIQPKLMEDLMSKAILKDEKYTYLFIHKTLWSISQVWTS